MKTALDTNVLSALWSNEPASSNISSSLAAARAQGALVVCAPVYVELVAHPSVTQDFVGRFLREMGIRVDFELDEPVWQQAAKNFAVYAQRRRRSGGATPRRLIADFVIASHAMLHADRLMTLDTTRYSRDFPGLRLV